ncbi:MAG: ATP-binding protein, partial [Acetobacteraceae bacterium]|nr:ATP-binding protein [Acetobacteraceae bacterium]
MIKRFLPRGLLGRSLLIVLVPLVILQAVTFTIFYGGHLDFISRRLSFAIAGEIAQTIQLLHRYPEDARYTMNNAMRLYEVPMRLIPGSRLEIRPRVNLPGPMDDDLAAALEAKVRLPFTMDWTSDSRAVLIRVQLAGGVLEVEAPRKRLYPSTVYLFVLWVVGTALLLFGIAALFLRNQVRAIRRLAAAAEAFGLGRDRGPIKPEGATEVRQAATAFNRMQARVQRFLSQRTEMLAGVSHDLRTPLTRLRLALAVLPKTPELEADIADMTADTAEMERMIAGYLAFARGEGAEQAQPVDISALLEDVASAARRAGAAIDLAQCESLTVRLRPDAARRAVTNLVNNARRHATRIQLSVQPQGRSVSVLVDDNGPGIAPERRESVFRPFESGADEGTGLGLTIARDIARAHGGEIHLEQSPLGGLRARLRLP